MNVRKLLSGNRRLDRYLVAVYAVGAAAVATGLWVGGVRVTTDLALLTLYGAAAAPFLVSLGTNAFLSTAFPFVLASAILLGPGGAVLTAAASSLSLGLARRNRLAPYKVAFNLSSYVLGGVTSALLFRGLGGDPGALAAESSLRAFLGATCGFYLVNTFLVSGAVALENGVPVMGIWIEKFQWTAYSFLAGGSFALLAILFLQTAGIYSFLIIFPFCALIYHSWKVYAVATGLGGSEVREPCRSSRGGRVGPPLGGGTAIL